MNEKQRIYISNSNVEEKELAGMIDENSTTTHFELASRRNYKCLMKVEEY
jgi:hypothetical protein